MTSFQLHYHVLTDSPRLTVDAQSRPIPKVMLEHPWIIAMMNKEAHRAKWIAQVWDWPGRKRRERYAQFALVE